MNRLGLGGIIGGICVGCAQLIAAGILLTIGFHLGNKIIQRMEKGRRTA